MTGPRLPERSVRIVLAAGGTGGHLMPALAAAEAIARRVPAEFLVFGSQRDSERAIRGLVPYPVEEIRVRALAGAGVAGKLAGLLTLPGSVIVARKKLQAFEPDLVIATGGYVCGPTGVAARLLGIPLLLLEQNADAGLTTRWLRHLADAIGVSFAQTAAQLGRRAVVTGNPIRSSLPAAHSRSGKGRGEAGAGAVRLLILGGSQGARGLNTMVQLAIPLLAAADVGIRVTHQTGARDVEMLRACWAEHGIPATTTPFLNNIGDEYARADLVCARAGATTIAELTYCGLPSILVPFPQAAARHQHANARALERHGAAVIVEEVAHGRPLATEIVRIASNRGVLSAMAAAAAALGRDDAADAVAELALDLALSSRSFDPGSRPTGRDTAATVSEAP